MKTALVVGGGLAGASAALAFADAGWAVTVVEARDRLGGRAFSPHWDVAGGPVELGGSWIRADHHAIRALAQRLGQPLTPRPTLVHHARFPVTEGWDAALAQALAAGVTDADQTLTGWMDAHALPAGARREVLAWWSISGSGDPALVAASELVTPKVRAGMVPRKLDELAFTFANGVQALAKAAVAASGARVVLDDAVNALDQSGSGVSARLGSGATLTADAAVLAVPLNTLGAITLPGLSPDQVALAGRGHAGKAIKLVIRATGVATGSLATGEHAGLRWLWADRGLPGGGTLVIAFGLQADVPDPASAARKAVAAAFPGAVVTDVIWHDWCADPWARGTWVAPFAGSAHLHDQDVWPTLGRIAFAGSDISGDEAGWFEGAVVTGQAAARSLT